MSLTKVLSNYAGTFMLLVTIGGLMYSVAAGVNRSKANHSDIASNTYSITLQANKVEDNASKVALCTNTIDTLKEVGGKAKSDYSSLKNEIVRLQETDKGLISLTSRLDGIITHGS